MTKRQIICNLWDELREAIDKAYASGACPNLRDYAREISWNDDLEKLLSRETDNERQHRSGGRAIAGFSASTAAKLLLMGGILSGAQRESMPSGVEMLIMRHTAFEASVIGFMIRAYLQEGWKQAVASLDYAKLMSGAA